MSKKIIVYMLCIAQIGAANILYGSCPPVLDGMNLWRLTAQISSCVDSLACSVGVQSEIQQSSLPLFITTSGHYKLCENVSNGLINIGASDVILDLGGYYMDNVSVTIANGQENVTVKNGVIKNTAQCFDIGPNTQNILLEDIVIDTIVPFISNPAFTWAVRVSSGPVTGLTIRNVTIYNGCPTNIVLAGSGLNYLTDIVLENIACVGTNPVFVTAPANPSAVIRLILCNDLVLKNIKLINQFQELNGILLDTCNNIQADGITITSILEAPSASTIAYDLDECGDSVHKNISIDGGSSKVFSIGINSSNVVTHTALFDNCLVTNVSTYGISASLYDSLMNCKANLCDLNGFELNGGDSFITNCESFFNGGNGYSISGIAPYVFENCRAYANSGQGFFVQSENSQFFGCESIDNTNSGFEVLSDGCTFDQCIANNNGDNGFDINVTDGCYVSNSIVNKNSSYGILVNNINAEAFFSLGVPQLGTYNIGQLQPTLPTTNNRNVKIVNNIGLQNGVGEVNTFSMRGTLYDNGLVPVGPIPFTTPIFPPIGVVNTIRGIVLASPFPLPTTIIGPLTSNVLLIGGTIGGNLVGA